MGQYKLKKPLKCHAWKDSLCWYHNIQITQDKVTESKCVPKFTLDETSGLGTTLFECQITTTSELSDVGLKEFCCIFWATEKQFVLFKIMVFWNVML